MEYHGIDDDIGFWDDRCVTKLHRGYCNENLDENCLVVRRELLR